MGVDVYCYVCRCRAIRALRVLIVKAHIHGGKVSQEGRALDCRELAAVQGGDLRLLAAAGCERTDNRKRCFRASMMVELSRRHFGFGGAAWKIEVAGSRHVHSRAWGRTSSDNEGDFCVGGGGRDVCF